MIRIPRKQLNAAIEALMIAAVQARNTNGLRILYQITPKQAEAAVLGALSILAPHGGPCTAADVVFVHTPFSTDPSKAPESVEFPPPIPGTDHKREEEKT